MRGCFLFPLQIGMDVSFEIQGVFVGNRPGVFRLNDLDGSEEDLARISINTEGVLRPEFIGVNTQDLCLFVNIERFTSGDARLGHSARIDGGVRSHSAFTREHSSKSSDAPNIVRRCPVRYEDEVLSGLGPFDGPLSA